MCFSLACGKSKKKDDPVNDPVTLSTPVVSVDNTNGKATWDEVEHASGYVYKINNGDEKTDATKTDGKYTVQLSNGQSIQVKALGDGTNYKDSAWSTAKTYTAGQAGDDLGDITLPETAFPVTSIPELGELVPNAGDTTDEKYYAIGAVKSVSDAYYPDIYILDEDGNTLHVYGLLNEDGSVRYTDKTPKASEIIKVGDAIVVYGVMTNYGGEIELKNAWLVQLNEEAKTDVAKVLLADLTGVPLNATEDFELPTAGGKITWTVKSGTGITIEAGSNLAQVTRTAEEQTAVLTATANVDGVIATKDYTVTIQLEIAGQQEIILTTNSLNVPDGYTNSGSATVNGTPFSWIGLGGYGWIQMRTNTDKTGTSSFWNTTAFSYDIFEVEFTFNETKQDTNSKTANLLKVELSNSADFTDVKTVYVSYTKGQSSIITPDDSYTYIRITHNNQGAVYLDEVSVLCKAIGDADKVAAAKAAIEVSPSHYYATADNIQLPNKHGDVTLTWSVKNDADKEWVTIENNVMSILKLPDSDEKEITLSVHLSLGDASDDRDDIVIYIVASNAPGSASNPYSVTEALAVISELGSGDYTDIQVYVEGYVIDCGGWNSNFGNFTNVYIADSATSTITSPDALLVFRLYPDGTVVKVQSDLKLGAKIVAYGYLQKYTNGTPEMTYQGNDNPIIKSYEAPTDETKVALALKAVKDQLPAVTKVENVTLPVSTVDGVTFKWSSSDSTYTVDEAGLILNVPSLPQDEDKEVILTVTATCGSVNSNNTKTVKIIIKKAPDEGQEDKEPITVTLTATNLSLGGTYAGGTATVDTVGFAYYFMKSSAGEIQGRQNSDASKNSYLYNTSAFSGRIISIAITYGTTASNASTQWSCYFGDSSMSSNPTSGAKSEKANTGTLTFTQDEGSDCTYFRLVRTGSGACYMSSITITYAA